MIEIHENEMILVKRLANTLINEMTDNIDSYCSKADWLNHASKEMCLNKALKVYLYAELSEMTVRVFIIKWGTKRLVYSTRHNIDLSVYREPDPMPALIFKARGYRKPVTKREMAMNRPIK